MILALRKEASGQNQGCITLAALRRRRWCTVPAEAEVSKRKPGVGFARNFASGNRGSVFHRPIQII